MNSEPANERNELTLMSWNIHGGRDRHGDHFPALKQALAVGADIVSLQEIEMLGQDHGHLSTDEVEVDKNGYGTTLMASFSPSPFDTNFQLAVGLLSPLTVASAFALTLPNPVVQLGVKDNFHDKGVISAVFDWGGVTIDIVALHAFPFHVAGLDDRDSRLSCVWDKLSEWIQPRDNVPRIVLGDFNTEHKTELLAPLRSNQLRSLFSELPTRDSGQSHDDILLTRHWNVAGTKCQRSASDHHMLTARVTLK